MKLRIRDNSLRLRLMQGEVRQLRDEGRVAARAEFPTGGALVYVVEASPASVRPDAVLEGTAVTVRLPESMVRDWADSDAVSMRDELALDTGGRLTVLVEKDFACLAPRKGEDESDMFPNPEAPATHDHDG